MIVPQQTAEALTRLDAARAPPDFVSRSDDLVVETLVISFFVVVRQVLSNGVSQRAFAEENQPVQALGFQ